ncbi:MAG: hypothetical protein NC420_02785 [Eubacterium sp.]|nr:hypothetical protein [Eubacterium sp.]MCM1216595.1 hypothetical protein [Lachnospiraceae bacterium]MCM1303001.1 hypothetical protein [Butyrivibrio sp.]MCM1343790.1 hypothetical protein [Muribaculaceae bacterium]MCM1239736.1 hypothetical protein [Lachnospiraceae bacterium]
MNSNEIKRRKIQGAANSIFLITMIAVGRMAGDNGVTYIAVTAFAFAVLWALCCGHTADTLGKLLRVRNAKGQYKSAAKMRRNIMMFQLAAGLAGTAVMLFGAGVIAGRLFQVHYSIYLMMLLSPALLLRGVSAVLMGYCQGDGSEMPPAAASVLRQVFILVFSLIFCRFLGDYGEKVSRLLVQADFASMHTAAGFCIAVDVSEVIVILFLLVIRRIGRYSRRKEQLEGLRATDSFMGAVQSFTAGRAPFLGIQLLLLLPVLSGFLFFEKNVPDWEAGMRDYGAYCGKYLAVSVLIVLLTAGAFIQICSKTVITLRKGEPRFARVIFQSGVHITVIHSLFLAAILAVLSTQAADLLDPDNGALAGKLFRGGALMIPFAALAFYFARFLILTGKNLLVLGALVISDVIYILSMTLFLNVWKAGILALVYAGIMGSAVCCILLGVITYKQLRVGDLWLQIFVIPGGAACITGLLCMLLSKLISPHLGDAVTLIVCIALSAAVYWLLLLLARNFSEQELENIPGGKWIISFGQMLHLL